MPEKFPSNISEKDDIESDGISRRNFLKKTIKSAAGFALASGGLQLKEFFGTKENQVAESKESYDIKRVKEQVHHISGRTWEFQSMAENGEYYPSFHDALFERKKTSTSSEISGDFSDDLKIYNQFGTFVETTDSPHFGDLLKKYDDRILVNENSRKVIKYLLQDNYVFVAMKQFFEDGGKIKSGKGHYSPEPLEIEFGNSEDEARNEATLYHEILHYIFDKKDSSLSESHDTFGSDHHAIKPLEERFNIISSISHGKAPLGEDIENLYGFTSEGRAGERINQILNDGNLQEFNRYISSDDFYKNYVHSGLVSPLGSNQYNRNRRDIIYELSNGHTLRIMENYTQGDADSIEKNKFGGVEGTYIDIKIRDIKELQIESLSSYVPSSDKENIQLFLREHIKDVDKQRGHILTPDQIHDISFLHAYNAIILENSFIIAIEFSRKKSIPLKEVFSQQGYKRIFRVFLEKFTSLEQQEKKHFPARVKAREITEQLMQAI
ncbi:MAG: hypothetical protein WCX12_03945 [Candidatus Paceibacterota bacterium]|jgi:hypothetical protein